MGQLVSKFSHFFHKWQDRPTASPIREPNPKRRVVDVNMLSTSADPKIMLTPRYLELSPTLEDSILPSTSVDPTLPSTSIDLIPLFTFVGFILPSTHVDSALPLTLTGPVLSKPIKQVTFHLLLPTEDKCRDVGIVKESLSRDLKWTRQEVLWFHSKGVIAISSTEGGVRYIEVQKLVKFYLAHLNDT